MRSPFPLRVPALQAALSALIENNFFWYLYKAINQSLPLRPYHHSHV